MVYQYLVNISTSLFFVTPYLLLARLNLLCIIIIYCILQNKIRV